MRSVVPEAQSRSYALAVAVDAEQDHARRGGHGQARQLPFRSTSLPVNRLSPADVSGAEFGDAGGTPSYIGKCELHVSDRGGHVGRRGRRIVSRVDLPGDLRRRREHIRGVCGQRKPGDSTGGSRADSNVTGCHVSLKPNSGPVTASRRSRARPVRRSTSCQLYRRRGSRTD